METDFLHRLLDYFQINESQYEELIREVDESSFAAGHHFDQIEEAAAMVKSVINENGSILIYGDYDADGIMGTSILKKMFKMVGYNALSYVPSRYMDGYALNMDKAIKTVEKGVKLVITVDNGITAFEPIDYLKNNNVKVLVLDHHQMQDCLPNADYILHPVVSHFGDTATSGAFVAFMFSIAFLGRFDKYLATLASISLISDMMPLKEYNRDLLRYVIKNYKNKEFPAIDLLKEEDSFDENAIGMRIAPKINAIGRIVEDDSINHLIDFFVTDDYQKQLNYIRWIENTNLQRKELTKQVLDDIVEIPSDQKAIVLNLDIKEGLNGLVSNHIVNKYNVPVIIFTHDDKNSSYKGSCRAPEGFNVVEAFSKLSSHLITFGGHAMAGGCSLKEENLDSFISAFKELAENTPIIKPEEKHIDLNITELTMENYQILNSFAPFGIGWKAPNFLLKKIKVASLTYSRSLDHILTTIGNSTKLTGFNFSKEYMSQFAYVNCLGKLRINNFKGHGNLEFLIHEVESV